jgi:hypothetical protein
MPQPGRHKETNMNDDRVNMKIRRFLKKVGVTSQREIEKALQAAIDSGKLKGNEKVAVSIRLEIPGIGLVHALDESISLE